MFLSHPIHFLEFLVKSQPQLSYKKGSYIKKKKRVYTVLTVINLGIKMKVDQLNKLKCSQILFFF